MKFDLHKKHFQLMAVLLLLSVLAVGCTSSGEETVDLMPIRVGFPVATLINGQIGQALAHTDIMEQNGLDGEVTGFAFGSPMMEAMAAGEIDVAFTTEGPATRLIATGSPAVIIASLGGANSGLLVLPDSAVQEMEDLRGLTVAVPFGSTPHVHLIRWLTDAGLQPDEDVTVINLGTGELEPALAGGDVDAIVFWEPNTSQLVQKIDARLIKEDQFTFATIMRREYLEKNREAAARFLAAIREATVYMATHKEQVNQWFSEGSRADVELIHMASLGTPAYAEGQTLADVNLELTPEVVAKFQDTADFYIEQDLADTAVNMTSAVDVALWEESQAFVDLDNFNPDDVVITDEQ